MPLDDLTVGGKITSWDNAALLMLDRMKSYDKKFDVVVDELRELNGTVNKIASKIASHDVKLFVYDILTAFAILGVVGFGVSKILG